MTAPTSPGDGWIPMSADPRVDIRDLIERFHDAVNHRDYGVFAGLFAEDAVWEVAPPFELRYEGKAAITEGVTGSVEKLEFLIQSCSAIAIRIEDGTNASARTSMQEFGRFRDGNSMRVAGTYFDRFRKDEQGRWHFVHRLFRAQYAENTPLTGHVFPSEG